MLSQRTALEQRRRFRFSSQPGIHNPRYTFNTVNDRLLPHLGGLLALESDDLASLAADT